MTDGPPVPRAANERQSSYAVRRKSSRDATVPDASLGPRRPERSDPGVVGGVVLRRRRTTRRGTSGRPVRGVRRRLADAPETVLLPHLPMEIPRSLLLGLGAVLYDAPGPVPLSDLRH